MQNIGYFAPWSRQNSWADRIAINNIRKSNTPQVRASPPAVCCVHGALVHLSYFRSPVLVSNPPAPPLCPLHQFSFPDR